MYIYIYIYTYTFVCMCVCVNERYIEKNLNIALFQIIIRSSEVLFFSTYLFTQISNEKLQNYLFQFIS